MVSHGQGLQISKLCEAVYYYRSEYCLRLIGVVMHICVGEALWKVDACHVVDVLSANPSMVLK